MHAILISMGTDGDVYPYLGLAVVLRGRGHRVTVLTHSNYESTAKSLGAEFRSIVSEEETAEFLQNPDVWHPIKCGPTGAKWARKFFRPWYDALVETVTDDAVIVASPGVVSARILHDFRRVPLVSIVLQPWMIPSSIEPPLLEPFPLPRWFPMPLSWLYWRLVDAAGDHLVGGEINSLRSSVGLRPVKRVFRWWLSPERVISFFPEAYAKPCADWPPQMRLAGFPMFDGRSDENLSSEVEDFLDAGDPPIAFTFGTGMLHAASLFRAAVEVCSNLSARAVLLTRHTDQIAATLPPNVLAVPYAPFRALFPRCAAVVHHGGIGTVAKALASGTPQLITPFAFDQCDNAARLERLGVGRNLSRRDRSPRAMERALREVLNPACRERAAQAAPTFADDSALERAAGWVEELAP
ncbi:MAG: nucleotide disphospho-sugar-binding domain-containing protein [Planctomycetota bacterium]